MASHRKKYIAPVAYYVHINNVGVHVSNKYTAILILELFVSGASRNDVVEMKSIFPPNQWPTWSRRHIISLLNGCWYSAILARYVYKDNKLVSVIDYTKSNHKPDHYERHAEFMHDALTQGEKQTLNYILSTPEILKLILQAPTASSARIAMKYINSISSMSIPLTHVVTCWKFLKLQHERRRQEETAR